MKRIDENHLKEIFENFSWSPWYATYDEKVPNVLSSKYNLGILDYSTFTNRVRFIQHKNHYYSFNLVGKDIRITPRVANGDRLIDSSEFMTTYIPIRKWNKIMVDIFQPNRTITCYFDDWKEKYVQVEKLVSVNKSPMNEYTFNAKFTNDILFNDIGLKTTVFKHYAKMKSIKFSGEGRAINKIFDESEIFNAPINLLYKVSKLPVTIIDSDNQLGFCGYSMSSTISELKEIKIPFKIKKEYYSEIIWLIQDCLELGEVLSFVKNKITIRKVSTEYYD